MFFSMTNAPVTFQWTMDWVFQPLKSRYPGMIFVYMDNILIATSNDEPLHEQIVHEVLEMLQKEDFFLKLHKCHFHQRTVDHLGIRIEGGIICIDPTKRDGLADWPKELENVHQVQSTLGVFGYQCPFILGYVKIMRPVQ